MVLCLLYRWTLPKPIPSILYNPLVLHSLFWRHSSYDQGGKGQQPNAYGLYHPTSNHPSSNCFSTHWVIPLLSLSTFARPKIFLFDIRTSIDPPTSEVFQTTWFPTIIHTSEQIWYFERTTNWHKIAWYFLSYRRSQGLVSIKTSWDLCEFGYWKPELLMGLHSFQPRISKVSYRMLSTLFSLENTKSLGRRFPKVRYWNS